MQHFGERMMEQAIWPGIVALIGGLWYYYKLTNDRRIDDLKSSHTTTRETLTTAHDLRLKDLQSSTERERKAASAALETMRLERDEARAENREFAQIVKVNSNALERVGGLSAEMIEAQRIMAAYIERVASSNSATHGETEHQAPSNSAQDQERSQR